MLAEARDILQTQATDTKFDELVSDIAYGLFTRNKRGHTGEIAYQNGGGKLFAHFAMANKDYYLYHGEIQLIDKNCDAIARDLHDAEHVIVIGPGPATSFSRKELPILGRLPKLKAVSLVDLNDEFNKRAKGLIAGSTAEHLQRVQIESFRMDFREAPSVIPAKGKTAVLITGGTIANPSNPPLDGFPDQDMQKMLTVCRDLAGDNGYVMLGYDTNNWETSLAKAYDPSLGPFIKNILKIIADHTSGLNGFDSKPENFRYEMKWHKNAGQVAHTLFFEKPQQFTIKHAGQLMVCDFDTDQSLIMMTSVKPTQQKMTQLGSYAGLEMINGYSEKHGLVEQIFKSVPRPIF